MSRVLCDSILSQFESTWKMLEKAFQSVTEEHWMEHVDGWTYADVVYHIIITQVFYIRDSPEGMKWGELYGNPEDKEENPSLYYPDKATLIEYFESTKKSVKGYLGSLSDEDLYNSDGFKGHLGLIHTKLVYLLRHNAHHLGELAIIHRSIGLDRIDWK